MTTYATPHDEAPDLSRPCAWSGTCNEGCRPSDPCLLETITCGACDGTGRTHCWRCNGTGESVTGMVGVGRCGLCKGSGELGCEACA